MQEIGILVISIPFSRSSGAFFLSAEWNSSGYCGPAGFADLSFGSSDIWGGKEGETKESTGTVIPFFLSSCKAQR
jgi:hypothetical protein